MCYNSDGKEGQKKNELDNRLKSEWNDDIFSNICIERTKKTKKKEYSRSWMQWRTVV